MINGKWHDQGSAAQVDAALHIEDGRYRLETSMGTALSGVVDEIAVSERLGNVERRLSLGDGSVFVTRDNTSVDLAFSHRLKVNSLIHRLERNMGWAIFALVLAVATTFSFFKWGVPWTSQAIAHALPQKTNDLIGASTLEFLDDYVFEPSQLDGLQQERIREHFLTSVLPLDKDRETRDYRLHFRALDFQDNPIPNALALPSGDIILTDKFVELSHSQEEIDSVLLHEMGHVEYRHSLKTIVQGTLVTTSILLFTGDASGATDMGLGLGSALLSTSYSRGHEAEADQYAFEHMLLAQKDPSSFADIMQRITAYAGEPPASEVKPSSEASLLVNDTPDSSDDHAHSLDQPDSADEANHIDDGDSILDYFSTHPSTPSRVAQAKRYAECYKKGLLVCDVTKAE